MTMNDCYADLQWKRGNGAERKRKCTVEQKKRTAKFNIVAKSCAERNRY